MGNPAWAKVGLSDCIETFQQCDMDGKTLLKFNEGRCMSLQGISMKMKRELWGHLKNINSNPFPGSRTKIISKGVQKITNITSHKQPATLVPPIDYPTHEDSDDGGWSENEFDSGPEDSPASQNHTSYNYETPALPPDEDDFYEQADAGDHGDVATDDDYMQPTTAVPPTNRRVPDLPSQFTFTPHFPEPPPEDEDEYEQTSCITANHNNTQNHRPSQPFKSSTMPSVPFPPSSLKTSDKSNSLPPLPTPTKQKDDDAPATGTVSALKAQIFSKGGAPILPQKPVLPVKKTVPTPPSSSIKEFPPPPSVSKRGSTDSCSSISSFSSDSGSTSIAPPPIPPRIPFPTPTPLPSTGRSVPDGTESFKEPRRGSIPLPQPPSSSTSSNATSSDSESWDDLDMNPWYHGRVGREYAQRKLQLLQEDGTFLVRRSTQGPLQPYTLEVISESTIKRVPIRLRDDGKYALGSQKAGEMTFNGVADLIVYHKDNVILIAGSQGAQVILKRTPPK